MAEIQFHPHARDEVSAAFEWYLARNISAARAFTAQLDEAVSRISERPEAWPNHIAGTRRFNLRLFPFQVVYRIGSNVIEIVAVAHEKRRPGYWRERDGSP